MDPVANQIPQFEFNVKPVDIGEGYAKGITAAGQSIAGGVTSAFNTLNQNRTADDTLAAMHQSGMLSQDAYQAVAGKSLGAKQQMLGMYAGEWINQQAQARELQKTGYAGAVDVQKQIQIMQAQFNQALAAIKSGYPGAAAINPKTIIAQPGSAGGGQTGGGQQPPVMIPPTGQPGAGVGGSPTPMRYQGGMQPGPVIGAPVTKTDVPPPGAALVQGTGPNGQTQHFLRLPDGTLRPIQ